MSTMDAPTALVLTVQLMALFSIAGALLLYLLCKIRGQPGDPASDDGDIGGGRAVIVTSIDTAFGLQVALHLSSRGFRVFAGVRGDMREDEECAALRAARAWRKQKESSGGIPRGSQGSLVALPLDVTREDLLHEAADIIRAHLPAGEDGVWAVINTSGVTYRGKLDHQDIGHWDAMLKTNVVGVLRTARAFQGLLRNTHGRFIMVGASNMANNATDGPGLVAYMASRYGAQGASDALRHELAPYGIRVVTLTPDGISTDAMFAPPKLQEKVQESTEVAVDISETVVEIHPKVLSPGGLNGIEQALTCANPNNSYSLAQKKQWFKQLDFMQKS